MKRALALPLLMLVTALPAQAFDYIAGFRDWAVYRDTINGELVCYATTPATDKTPRSADHGDVHFFVTYFRNSALPQNSMRVAYDFREDMPAEASVSGRSWKLYTVRNEIFANDDDERAIRDSLRSGSELRVEATSERNTQVTYHFSLSGSASAIDRAQSLCN